MIGGASPGTPATLTGALASRPGAADPGRDPAVAPVVGVALLLAVTVVAAAGVGATALSVTPAQPGDRVAVTVTADAGADRIAVRHDGGDLLDVRELSLSVRVEDEPLDYQPPIPYFAASGFLGGPTGPFNRAADHNWSAGERASLRIASTNDPRPSPGDRVTVVLSTDRRVLARTETRAT